MTGLAQRLGDNTVYQDCFQYSVHVFSDVSCFIPITAISVIDSAIDGQSLLSLRFSYMQQAIKMFFCHKHCDVVYHWLQISRQYLLVDFFLSTVQTIECTFCVSFISSFILLLSSSFLTLFLMKYSLAAICDPDTRFTTSDAPIESEAFSPAHFFSFPLLHLPSSFLVCL